MDFEKEKNEMYGLQEIAEEISFLINNRLTEEERYNGILTIRRKAHTMSKCIDNKTFKKYSYSDAVIPIQGITNIYTEDQDTSLAIEYKGKGSKISIIKTDGYPFVIFFSYKKNEGLLDNMPVYLHSVSEDNKFFKFE